jgi:ABC-2 type transport system permease protein
MISVLLRINRTALRRDRVAQTMTFVLPIAFFSIFAMVFGRSSMSSMERLRIAVVDEDRSAASTALIRALKADSALVVRDSARVRGAAASAPRALLDRARAEAMVKAGDVPLAVILPAGWGKTFPNFAGGGTPADVLADPSDPVAINLFRGMLQRAGARAMRAAMSPGGLGQAGPAPEPLALVAARYTAVLGDKASGQSRMVPFYAAGIAVMFLLFSCASAGGSLLDEQESGTLERVLNTNVGMSGLLAGKWIHLTLLGLTQITVMFVWGMLMFGLDLLGHLPGFFIMTVVTAAAAAGFGLVLATLCHTRQQLGGVATLLILVMSAMGGSMFPRFLMSAEMQRVGLLTFNAWALDGYVKVFWREAPLIELWPQVLVLVLLTTVFLTTARLLARRWEAA